ncbi:MAG TPA: pilus assembly protein PilM, partial [bacterium]|nr:pilus assembly protein PilM [bacterium]
EGRSVRIVRMDKGGEGRRRVAAFGELDIDLWHAGPMDQQRFKSAVKQLGGGNVKVAVNMEHPTLRVRRMTFAKMPERDMMEAIRWNFREHVEGAIEQYVVGYTPLDVQAEGGKLVIMAYGVAQDAVKEYTNLMRSFGLKLVSLEPQATALLASFTEAGVLDDGRYHVCISFGDVLTQFTVMRGRSMLFSRPLAGIGTDSLIRLIMRNLNLEEAEAREALLLWMESNRGDAASAAEADEKSEAAVKMRRIETTMGHFLSQLVIEVQRSVDAFCIMYGIEHVSDIYVCGEGVMFPGIASHMQKTLGIETKIFNPLEALLDEDRRTPEAMARSPLYAVAAGLAIP